MGQTDAFRAARDLLQRHRTDYETAVAEFRWPDLEHFNFGFDWFDVLAAEQPDVPAVWIVDPKTKTASLTPVTVGAYEAGAVLIKEGLEAGDRVVIDGGKLRSSGQPGTYGEARS